MLSAALATVLASLATPTLVVLGETALLWLTAAVVVTAGGVALVAAPVTIPVLLVAIPVLLSVFHVMQLALVDLALVADAGTSDCECLPEPKPEECKEPDCKAASRFQLRQAGITDPYKFKDFWEAKPNSQFDICACKDGSIVIKAHGACGKSGPAIVTDARWK